MPCIGARDISAMMKNRMASLTQCKQQYEHVLVQKMKAKDFLSSCFTSSVRKDVTVYLMCKMLFLL